MDAAIAIARGQVLGTTASAERTAALGDAPDLGDAPPAASVSRARQRRIAQSAGAAAGGDEQAAAELMLVLMETAQMLAGQLAALVGVDFTQLPAPWQSFAREALTMIQTTIQPYLSM